MRVVLALAAILVASGSAAGDGGDQLLFQRDGRAWVMHADGTAQRRLPVRIAPSVSADGKWVAWWANGARISRLFVARSDWSDRREVARDSGYQCFAPQWSPDATRLTYRLDCDVDLIQNFVIDRDGSHRRMLRASRWNIGGEWSPDGRRILLCSVSQHGLWWFHVVDARTYAVRRIPRFHYVLGGYFAWFWAPSGRTIYVESDTSLWSVDVESGRSRALASRLKVRSASSSPDGRWLALQANPGTSDDWEIVVMRPDGTSFRQLTDNRVQDVEPRWSPDSRRIAFTSGRGSAAQIYVMSADGSGQTNVSRSTSDDLSAE